MVVSAIAKSRDPNNLGPLDQSLSSSFHVEQLPCGCSWNGGHEYTSGFGLCDWAGICCGVDLVDRNPRDVVEPSAVKLIPKPNQKELDTPCYYQFYGTQP
jgi:hypothetical protein